MATVVIGPTFADELRAAWLAGLPFCWGSTTGLHDLSALTDAQRAGVAAVLATHDQTRAIPVAPDKLVVLATDLSAATTLAGLNAAMLKWAESV